MSGYIDPTKESFAAFRADDRPGPIHMLNLVRLRSRAAYPDGREATGAEAYAAYGRESEPVFTRLGGAIIWRGRFEQTLIGPTDERWDLCFIAQYPSRGGFRRHDPRPRLSRSGQAPPGGGGGFAARPPRSRRCGGWFWLKAAAYSCAKLLPRTWPSAKFTGMTKPMPWIIGAIGLAFVGVALVYWLTPAGGLPSFLPGFQAGSDNVHIKHALGALLIALALFAIAIAWFQIITSDY